MGCNPNKAVMVFRNAFLSTATGFVKEAVSAAVPVAGNMVVMSCTVINQSGLTNVGDLVFELQTSFDGNTWKTSSTIGSLTTFGYADVTIGPTSASFIRVAVRVTSSTSSALFDVVLSFASV